MTSSFIRTAAAYAVTVAIATAIVSQIVNGEPELPRAVASGLAFGVTVASIQQWRKKKVK